MDAQENFRSIGSREAWDECWRSHLNNGGIQNVLYLIRTKLIARSVRYFVDLFFNEEGVFIEAGSGSSQTSALIKKRARTFFCLDFALDALLCAKTVPAIDGVIHGNIFCLPFRGGSVDGIWNLGVMEHFTDDDINRILNEFYRTLKPEACVILFWPPLFGWYKLVSLSIEKLLSFIKKRTAKLYPEEINLFTERSKIEQFCEKHGFILEYSGKVWLDLFTYVVVITRKK